MSKPEITKIDIPKSIMDFMKKGICPTCKTPMRKANGNETHSKTKKMICEELLREKLKKLGHPVERSIAKVGDKEIEIDARFMSKPDADKLKKQTENDQRYAKGN